MPSKPTPEDWLRAAVRCPMIGDADKTLASELYLSMRPNRHVQVPAETLARRLGRHKRRVAERIANLHRAGLLDTVSRGQNGATAVYEGLIPTPARVPIHSTLSDTKKRHPQMDEGPRAAVAQGDGHRHPYYTADLSARGDDRDVGSEERRRGEAPVVSRDAIGDGDARWSA